jgi:hypothetical protein
MLDLAGSDPAWPLFMRALTGHDRASATYAAATLGEIDPGLARKAVPEIVRTLGRWNDRPADPL